MDYHNIFAREQLFKVVDSINGEIGSFQISDEDLCEVDLEFRRGVRDGLRIARSEIYERLAQLQSNYKQK